MFGAQKQAYRGGVPLGKLTRSLAGFVAGVAGIGSGNITGTDFTFAGLRLCLPVELPATDGRWGTGTIHSTAANINTFPPSLEITLK
jgi:hypothetical protein